MNPADQHRITPRHLDRSAIVYVRQSDPQQVREHTESTRIQRGLREKAISLGWANPTLIEDDQGITASGFADRPGFQWLLTQVTLRKVGIILCVEASRLSRNSRDWAHLFELCGYFDTLVADPQNRLVVDNLERRLNEKLAELQAARAELEHRHENDKPLTEEQRRAIDDLARDFPRLWSHPDTPATLRKQLLRTAIHEIIVIHKPDERRLEVTLHWQGDACTQLAVKKRATPVGSRTDGSLVELVTKLTASLGDGEIARILNMKKLLTPRGLRWTMDRVQRFRTQHGIRKPKQITAEDVLTGQQARDYLGIGYNGLLALIRRGLVHTHQVTDFAPWQIPRAELDSEQVQKVVRILKKTGRCPAEGGSPDSQESLLPGESST